MLEMRREIRAEREKTAFAADEAKRQIQNNLAILVLSALIIGVLGGGMYVLSTVL